MKTQAIPKDYQHTSPAGAEVRLLMNNQYGGMAHCTLKANIISKAVRHKTVSEFWYILSGKGQIWRKTANSDSITDLTPGISIDIPLGTDFQYCSSDVDLVFICITMPPWSGADNVMKYIYDGRIFSKETATEKLNGFVQHWEKHGFGITKMHLCY